MIKDTLLSQSKRYMSTLRFGFLILAIFFGSLVQAQQVPLFTQYRIAFYCRVTLSYLSSFT